MTGGLLSWGCVDVALKKAAHTRRHQHDTQDVALVGSSSCSTVFGRVVFGRTVFGRTVFGRTVFGRAVFGRTVFPVEQELDPTELDWESRSSCRATSTSGDSRLRGNDMVGPCSTTPLFLLWLAGFTKEPQVQRFMRRRILFFVCRFCLLARGVFCAGGEIFEFFFLGPR